MKKERGTLLTVWIILMILSNLFAIVSYLLFGSFYASFYQTPYLNVILLVPIGLINVLLAYLLWKWKVWGFYGLVVISMITFVLNLNVGINFFHALSGFVGIAITYLIIRRKWKYFN